MKLLERINYWFGFVKCPVCGTYLSRYCAVIEGKVEWALSRNPEWRKVKCKCGSMVQI